MTISSEEPIDYLKYNIPVPLFRGLTAKDLRRAADLYLGTDVGSKMTIGELVKWAVDGNWRLYPLNQVAKETDAQEKDAMRVVLEKKLSLIADNSSEVTTVKKTFLNFIEDHENLKVVDMCRNCGVEPGSKNCTEVLVNYCEGGYFKEVTVC